jgi:hypothetical protein
VVRHETHHFRAWKIEQDGRRVGFASGGRSFDSLYALWDAYDLVLKHPPVKSTDEKGGGAVSGSMREEAPPAAVLVRYEEFPTDPVGAVAEIFLRLGELSRPTPTSPASPCTFEERHVPNSDARLWVRSRAPKRTDAMHRKASASGRESLLPKRELARRVRARRLRLRGLRRLGTRCRGAESAFWHGDPLDCQASPCGTS